MDSYVRRFQEAGGSMIMLGKGNRSAQVKSSCAEFGGFYLGSIGGPAARLAQDCITSVEVLDMEELGMEAVWKIRVETSRRSSSPTTRAMTSSTAPVRRRSASAGPARCVTAPDWTELSK
jgi:hypothetical protein